MYGLEFCKAKLLYYSLSFFPELMHAEYHQQLRPPLKTQYYIEVPKNQTVNEGDTILLRCQVGNRQGVVQWTRNGFAMGKKFHQGY